jgi:hypothetical protein
MSLWPTHSNYNCKITAADGQESLIYANWLHNQGHDHWHGWHCQAGTRRLYIDKNLMVYSGECKNDCLGSALNDFEPLPNGTVCSRDSCGGCTDDLLTAKHSPNFTGS